MSKLLKLFGDGLKGKLNELKVAEFYGFIGKGINAQQNDYRIGMLGKVYSWRVDVAEGLGIVLFESGEVDGVEDDISLDEIVSVHVAVCCDLKGS